MGSSSADLDRGIVSNDGGDDDDEDNHRAVPGINAPVDGGAFQLATQFYPKTSVAECHCTEY